VSDINLTYGLTSLLFIFRIFAITPKIKYFCFGKQCCNVLMNIVLGRPSKSSINGARHFRRKSSGGWTKDETGR